jgi:hypothetical protein
MRTPSAAPPSAAPVAVAAPPPDLTRARVHGPTPSPANGPAWWAAFKRLTQLSWPKRFPIVQFPNAPLIIAFVAGETASHAHGSTHGGAQAISYLAMVIWAYEELFHGVNWFRNLLGLTYVISTAVHLTLALSH